MMRLSFSQRGEGQSYHLTYSNTHILAYSHTFSLRVEDTHNASHRVEDTHNPSHRVEDTHTHTQPHGVKGILIQILSCIK